MSTKIAQAQQFHQPLRVGDTETQTVGCRHTNPDICAKNHMIGQCAFARDDGMCHAPPKSWPKQYQLLLDEHGLPQNPEAP